MIWVSRVNKTKAIKLAGNIHNVIHPKTQFIKMRLELNCLASLWTLLQAGLLNLSVCRGRFCAKLRSLVTVFALQCQALQRVSEIE